MADKPEPGKQYRLTGGPGVECIANGNTWEESEALPEVNHPDLDWARLTVIKAKGERVTTEELDTLIWDGLMGCYLMQWRGMILGIEKDGHIHS